MRCTLLSSVTACCCLTSFSAAFAPRIPTRPYFGSRTHPKAAVRQTPNAASVDLAKTAALRSRNSYRGDDDDEKDDKDDEYFAREYQRVGRRSGRGRFADDEAAYDSGDRDRDRRGQKRYDYIDDDEDDEFSSDEDDDDDDDFDDIIPNPLLDQIDPDGAIDRFSELAADPKFWRDALILLFLAFWVLADKIDNPFTFMNVDEIDFRTAYL